MQRIIMYYVLVTSMLFCFMCCVSPQDMPPVDESNETAVEETSSCLNATGNADTCVPSTDIPSTTEEVMSVSTLTSTDDMESTVSMSTENIPNTAVTTAQAENFSATSSGTTNNNLSSSTETPKSTTLHVATTAASFTTNAPSSAPTRLPEDLCLCDLTMNMCDADCCCDPECSAGDREAFSSCYHKPSEDPRYCYHTQFIYRNNTELKMVQLRDDLFCIEKENLGTSVDYEDRRAMVSLEELNLALLGAKAYSWPSSVAQLPEFRAVRSHKAGEVIWELKNNSLLPLAIPISVTGSLCQSSQVVQYLRDFASYCTQLTPSSADVCETRAVLDAASYYRNLSIVTTWEETNETERTFSVEKCFNSSSCIVVHPFLCPWTESESPVDSGACISVANIPSPSFHNATSTCHNVVRRVKYFIQHNGTEGIIKVSAFITLSNISVSNSLQEQFTQGYGVEFVWASSEESAFRRSGRPGYLAGKPVIAGRKVWFISKDENSVVKAAIELDYDSNKWLGFPAVTNQGTCVSLVRQPVTFNENRRSTCLMPLHKMNFTNDNSCALIQKHILELLAGNAITNVTETKNLNLFIATFGDSLVENTGDWVGVVLDSLPSVVPLSTTKHDNRVLICKGIVTSMHMDIVFANVGALSNPQAKILGIVFRFGPVKDIAFDCSPLQCSAISDQTSKYFKVVNTVSFVDATKPAVAHFLEPPVYEIKLPHDFFYPFYSAAVIPKLNYLVFIWISATIFLIM